MESKPRTSFSANEKVNIARALLQSLKVDRIEVASACVSDGEQQAVAKILMIGLLKKVWSIGSRSLVSLIIKEALTGLKRLVVP